METNLMDDKKFRENFEEFEIGIKTKTICGFISVWPSFVILPLL